MYAMHISVFDPHILMLHVYVLFTLAIPPSTSQSVPALGFSQPQEESSYHIPATPEYVCTRYCLSLCVHSEVL